MLPSTSRRCAGRTSAYRRSCRSAMLQMQAPSLTATRQRVPEREKRTCSTGGCCDRRSCNSDALSSRTAKDTVVAEASRIARMSNAAPSIDAAPTIRNAASGRALQVALDVAEDGANLASCPHEVLARDVERRRDPDDGAVRVLRQNAARQQPIDDRTRGDFPRVDLDADEKAAAANVDHDVAAQVLQ